MAATHDIRRRHAGSRKLPLLSLALLLLSGYVSPLAAAEVRIANMPDYDWWYGCTATSFGMIFGYYDRNGFDNLIPGGTAPLSTFGQAPGIAENAIASAGHIHDFYSNDGNRGTNLEGTSGDDGSLGYSRNYAATEQLFAGATPSPTSFDSIADYLGTSQDGTHAPWKTHGVSNGGTSMVWYTDGGGNPTGTKVTAQALAAGGWGDVGLPGVLEYIIKQGYNVADLFFQIVEGVAVSGGFTFADFMNEIDNNRPVLVNVVGHSMVGYGYNDATNQIFVRDTWVAGGAINGGAITWGGSYSGMALHSVIALDMGGGGGGGGGAGGPEPGTMTLMALAGAGLWIVRRRSQRTDDAA